MENFNCGVRGSAFLLLFVSCSFSLTLSSRSSQTLDTFENVKVNIGKTVCTCSLTMIISNDIVNIKNAACNKKCKGSAQITLGGPASTAHIYNLVIKISKGSLTASRISANLFSNLTSSSPTTEGPITSSPPAIPNPSKPSLSVYPRLGGFFCENHIKECLDGDSFPNIGQAFRGYNLLLGDPLNFGGDPGFEGHIFDEAGERNGLVRFGNTAGNDLNRCDGSVRADYIETVDEFLESILKSGHSQKWFQIGSEVDLTFSVGYEAGASVAANVEIGASAEGCAELSGSVGANAGLGRKIGEDDPGKETEGRIAPALAAGGLGSLGSLLGAVAPSVGINGEVGAGVGGCVGVGGSVGAGAEAGASVSGSASASVTIPPLYQSVSSNSKVMADITEGLETKQISITRSSFSCYEYEFEITDFQHPTFTGQFISAVQGLESCLMAGPPFTGMDTEKNSSSTDRSFDLNMTLTTPLQDACVMNFLKNYGTHYIKAAKFGSKMSILTLMDSKASYFAKKDQVAKCATKSRSWSLLGIFGGGSDEENCMDDLFQAANGSVSMILDEIVVTVGSRPKADYSEWAEQQGKPEIIHKTIAPISNLFTNFFMKDILLNVEPNGVATIKPLLDKYLLFYCGVFRSHCNYVVAKPYCPDAVCTITTIGKCGHYTGPVDLNFLPHGEGSFITEDEALKMIWVHGCTANCSVQLYGAIPSGYQTASEEEVLQHKEWILHTMNQWAIAKFIDGYIYGPGYGGHITNSTEVGNFQHMVICKSEAVPPTTVKPKPETTYTLIKEKKTWIEAAQYCANNSMRLAIIKTLSELARVQSKLERRDAWLAGNDYKYEGHWRWAKGSPYGVWDDFITGGEAVGLDFNWHKGSGSEHDKDDEDCLHIRDDGEFDDEKCDDKLWFFCDDDI